MCMRIYRHYRVCGCMIYQSLWECELGVRSSACLYVTNGVINKRGRTCAYHRHMQHKCRPPAPPGRPMGARLWQIPPPPKISRATLPPHPRDPSRSPTPESSWDKQTAQWHSDEAEFTHGEGEEYDSSSDMSMEDNDRDGDESDEEEVEESEVDDTDGESDECESQSGMSSSQPIYEYENSREYQADFRNEVQFEELEYGGMESPWEQEDTGKAKDEEESDDKDEDMESDDVETAGDKDSDYIP